jgi:hypothetical protein
MAGYYRRFIEGFSKIARPMKALLAKKVDFKWTLAFQKSFDIEREVDNDTSTEFARWSQAILSKL